MTNLPISVVEKQIADFPWEHDAQVENPPRLDVTGHSDKSVGNFRDALNASKIPTKLAVENGKTYVVAATDVLGVEERLTEIRLKHLLLEDEHGQPVKSHTQINPTNTWTRKDNLFRDLSTEAEAGARAENPAAMESVANAFRRLGNYGVTIDEYTGKLNVLANEQNARLLEEVGAITGPYDLTLKPLAADSGAELARDGSGKTPAQTLSATETENYYKQFHAKEMPSLKTIAESFINHGRYTPGLVGALIITADAALAASPALDNGEYADAAMLALNSTSRLATEIVVATECTAEVATLAAPISVTPPIYAATVTAGAAACAIGSHDIMTYGDKAITAIEAYVKEVAANNGLDPDHIWSSMLEKIKEESATPIDPQQASER